MAEEQPTNIEVNNQPKPSEAKTPPEPRPEWVEWFRDYCVPVVGVLSISLGLCLANRWGSPTDWTRGKDLTYVFLNIVQVFALVLAGWWFIYKFIKGRTFQESLIPTVSGKLIVVNSKTFLVANVRVQNVGQSEITFAPEASSLKLFEYTDSPSTTGIVSVKDNTLTQFVALDDKTIEPNEIIHKTRFISIPDNKTVLGFRLELLIISNHRKKFSWATSAIVENLPINAIIQTDGAAGVA